jgi:hypothetical protein
MRWPSAFSKRISNHFLILNNKWIKISTSRFDADIEKVYVFWIFITREESQWHLIKFGKCFSQGTLKIVKSLIFNYIIFL